MTLKNWYLLERSAKYLGIDINSEEPRESRLKVALAYNEKEMFAESIEAMTGIPLDEYGDEKINQSMLIKNLMYKNRDPKEFYEGNFFDVDGK